MAVIEDIFADKLFDDVAKVRLAQYVNARYGSPR